MKIFLVEETDGYNDCGESVVSTTITGAYLKRENAEREIAVNNGGRYMSWDILEVEVKDA